MLHHLHSSLVSPRPALPIRAANVGGAGCRREAEAGGDSSRQSRGHSQQQPPPGPGELPDCSAVRSPSGKSITERRGKRHKKEVQTSFISLWPLFNFFFQPERVLQALKRYMAAEQKDRRHTLRHYQHIVAVDPQKAEQMKFQVCEISATRNAFRARLCFWYARAPFSADRETYGTLCAEELGLNSQRWSSSQSSFHYTEIKAGLCWLQKLPFDTWIHEKYLSGLSFFIHLRNQFTASLLTAKTTSTHILFDIVRTLCKKDQNSRHYDWIV